MRRDREPRSFRSWIMLALALLLVGLVGYSLIPRGPSLPGASVLLPEPTSTFKPGPTVIEAVQRQAKLESIAMVIQNDTTVVREHGFLGACTEELTYLAYFKVSAGVDLALLTSDRITVTNDGFPEQAEVIVTLPPAQLLHNELDTEQSRIVSQSSPRWVPGCSHEIADMTVEAQSKLRGYAQQAALEKGILIQAEENAGGELKRLLEAAGYRKVTVRYSQGGVGIGTPTPVPTAPPR
ncbi:MAG TPA: DUF4230 domain-containing protein [Herpetosiphonaceae bacterium]